MPIVISVAGGKLRIYIYSQDHNPPHVHVIYGKEEKKAVFTIEGQKLMFNDGFKAKDLKIISSLILRNEQQLMDRWNEYQEK